MSSIDFYCKDIDQYTKQNPTSKRLFANVGPGLKGAKDIWREFKSNEERSNVDDGYNLDENITIWQKVGVVVLAECLFQSPSRDWAHLNRNLGRNPFFSI